MGRALADHVHDNAVVCKNLQITGQTVALEFHVLHTDHHQAGLNVDFRYSVHKIPPLCPSHGRSN